MAALNFPNGPALGDKYPTPAVVGQPQYTWDGEKWTTVGTQISNATPSAAVPLMDATPGLPGAAAAYSRGDHVHPTDTTRAALSYVDANMVGYAAQTTTAAQKSQARANIAVTKKNYIINGGMMVSQENGANVGSTSGTAFYPVDMFSSGYAASTGVMNIAQVVSATPGGSRNRIRCAVATVDATVGAGDAIFVGAQIEGLRCADLNIGLGTAKTVTLQFGVKAPAGTYCVAFRNNPAYNRVYVAEYVIAVGEANTDVVKTITLTLDTTGTWPADNASALNIIWALMGGTTFQQTANTWQAGQGFVTANQVNFMANAVNTFFELFDVSLTEGAVAPPFQVPDYATELALCQRYWCKSFDYGTVPLNSGPIVRYAAFAESTATIDTQRVYYPVVMRGTPTMGFYSSATQGAASVNAQWQIYGIGAASFPSATGTGVTTPTTTSFVVNLTGFTGLSNGFSYLAYGGWVANARL